MTVDLPAPPVPVLPRPGPGRAGAEQAADVVGDPRDPGLEHRGVVSGVRALEPLGFGHRHAEAAGQDQVEVVAAAGPVPQADQLPVAVHADPGRPTADVGDSTVVHTEQGLGGRHLVDQGPAVQAGLLQHVMAGPGVGLANPRRVGGGGRRQLGGQLGLGSLAQLPDGSDGAGEVDDHAVPDRFRLYLVEINRLVTSVDDGQHHGGRTQIDPAAQPAAGRRSRGPHPGRRRGEELVRLDPGHRRHRARLSESYRPRQGRTS